MKDKPPDRSFKKEPEKRSRKDAAVGQAPSPEARHWPPDNTSQEAQYLTRLVANKTRVRVRLRDNEQVEGVVEYYDANFIRLTRDGAANLFIYKRDIRYLEE